MISHLFVQGKFSSYLSLFLDTHAYPTHWAYLKFTSKVFQTFYGTFAPRFSIAVFSPINFSDRIVKSVEKKTTSNEEYEHKLIFLL